MIVLNASWYTAAYISGVAFLDVFISLLLMQRVHKSWVPGRLGD
jgi:hypothetical protein